MKARMNSALIIGVDSMIGKALLSHLSFLGWHVFGTTRKKENLYDSNILYLDLSSPQKGFFDGKIDIVFFCAALTGVAACENNPEYANKVNVVAPTLLTQELMNQANFFVFLSSVAVFSGAYPFQEEKDQALPVTVYGKQKLETEQALLELTDKVAIVRLSKVLAKDSPLISNWIAALSKKEVIEPFSDLYVSPISINLVVEGLCKIVEEDRRGIIHLSGKEEVTYEYIARYLAKKMKASETLVKSRSVLTTELVPPVFPAHSSLAISPGLFSEGDPRFNVSAILDDLYAFSYR